jgi:hypothetical protein
MHDEMYDTIAKRISRFLAEYYAFHLECFFATPAGGYPQGSKLEKQVLRARYNSPRGGFISTLWVFDTLEEADQAIAYLERVFLRPHETQLKAALGR